VRGLDFFFFFEVWSVCLLKWGGGFVGTFFEVGSWFFCFFWVFFSFVWV